ncbi:MAG TPA: hypothetical protein PKD55_10250 [Bellilinea sp.]|nr:hypothetical protein [Bellilinea sp.]
MTEPTEVYSNIERKRELVDALKQLLADQMDASEVLDNKAWEILKVTSATFGLVSALEITLSSASVGNLFWVILAGVMLLYLCQVEAVMRVIRPRDWRLIPGGEDGVTTYNTLLPKYVAPDESTYLDQLIVDYAGGPNPKNEADILPGAISVAQAHNEDKAKWVRRAARLLSWIVVGLIVMAVVAVHNG